MSWWNSRWPITSRRVAPTARVVAVRGLPSTSAISPRKSPLPRVATTELPTSTRTVPSRTTKNSWPVSPSRVRTRPSATSISSASVPSCSSSRLPRPLKSGTRRSCSSFSSAIGGQHIAAIGRRIEAKPGKLDRGTSVHDDQQPGRLRPLGCRLVDHAQLEPHRPGTDRDRFIDVRPGEFGATEDVDHLDSSPVAVRGLRRRGQIRNGGEAQHRLLPGIDRYDLEAPADERAGDSVARTLRIRGAADHRPDVHLAQDALDDLRIGKPFRAGHRLRASSWSAALILASRAPSVPATAPAALRASLAV